MNFHDFENEFFYNLKNQNKKCISVIEKNEKLILK